MGAVLKKPNQKLKALGFKKEFPDEVDKKYFFWIKRFKHKFLKGAHIIVEGKISVYCDQADSIMRNDVVIYCETYTEQKLNDVMKWLDVK